MASIISIVILSGILLILVRGILKARNTTESRLGIFEHPATFKKPQIERVSTGIENNKKKKVSLPTAGSKTVKFNEPDDFDLQ